MIARTSRHSSVVGQSVVPVVSQHTQTHLLPDETTTVVESEAV